LSAFKFVLISQIWALFYTFLVVNTEYPRGALSCVNYSPKPLIGNSERMHLVCCLLHCNCSWLLGLVSTNTNWKIFLIYFSREPSTAVSGSIGYSKPKINKMRNLNPKKNTSLQKSDQSTQNGPWKSLLLSYLFSSWIPGMEEAEHTCPLQPLDKRFISLVTVPFDISYLCIHPEHFLADPSNYFCSNTVHFQL